MARTDYPDPFPSRGLYASFDYGHDANRRRKSTGKRNVRDARRLVSDFVDRLEASEEQQPAFAEYSEPFFDWGRWPLVQRKLAEGKAIGEKHARNSRRWLSCALKDEAFAALPVAEIRRRDVLDLRDRLREEHPPNTLNKVIDTVKTVLSEGFFRGDIDRDPGHRIGSIKYRQRTRGIFTAREIRSLTWRQVDGDVVTANRA